MKTVAIALAYALGAFLLGLLRPRRWIIVLACLAASCVDGKSPTGPCVLEVTFDGETLTMPTDTVTLNECGRAP